MEGNPRKMRISPMSRPRTNASSSDPNARGWHLYEGDKSVMGEQELPAQAELVRGHPHPYISALVDFRRVWHFHNFPAFDVHLTLPLALSGRAPWLRAARPDRLRLRSGQALAAQRALARDDSRIFPKQVTKAFPASRFPLLVL